MSCQTWLWIHPAPVRHDFRSFTSCLGPLANLASCTYDPSIYINFENLFALCKYFLALENHRSWKLQPASCWYTFAADKPQVAIISNYCLCVSQPLTHPFSTRQMQRQTRSCVGRYASSWTGWRMSVISWQHSWAQKTRHMHSSTESTSYSNRNWKTK